MPVYLFNRVPRKTVTKTPYELRTKKSPSIRHLHVWARPAEARSYIPYKKKLDSRTVNCLFVGYSERYRGFKFYCPSTKNIIETDNARFFFENIQNSESQLYKDFTFEEEHIIIHIITVPNDEVVTPLQNENIVISLQGTDTIHPEVEPADEVKPENSQPQVPDRSTRERIATIANDYIVYL